MLEVILPKILAEPYHIVYITFEGKQDLDKKIEAKVRGWLKPNSVFLILRDKDSSNCRTIKHEIKSKLSLTNKLDRCCIRIACHELESFSLGDLNAVEKGLNIKNVGKLQKKRQYRDPDLLANASDELKKLTNNQYQKVSGSRAIAPFFKFNWR